jgi:ABC-2 type transport system ATP-binding protein
VIEVRHLTKRYGARTAVEDLSFTVRPGRVTGFLGPNGAGKSTTMRMILGLDRPDEGIALVDGRPFVEHPWPLRSVGAVLDAKAVHPNRTARKHLLALAATVGEGAARVEHVLRLVGLTEVADERAGSYSLGMSQRLGLAGALLGDPQVLILDEPVNGLDPDGVRWIRSFLRALADEGRTVLLSSHLMSEMSQTAHHLVVIGKGRLIADMSTADMVSTAVPSAQVRSTQPERLHAVLTAAGAEIDVEGDGRLTVRHLGTDEIARLAMEHQVVLTELVAGRQSLEDAYLELTASSVEYAQHSPDHSHHAHHTHHAHRPGAPAAWAPSGKETRP